MGLSSYLLHRNETAFPNPTKFDPERWISQPIEQIRAAESCFVPFSRGSRSCLGQNLAMCELYVVLGTLFRQFENLRTTDVGELRYSDYFNPWPRDEAQELVVAGSNRT